MGSDGVRGSGAARRRAVVVGAGIAGLAAALRLHRAGWDALVVERSPHRRSSGYMVNLLGEGYRCADRLGLVPALRRTELGIFTTVLVRADGSPKFTIPAAIAEAALGPEALTVFRGDLESALYEAVCDTAEIRFGTAPRAIEHGDDGVEVALDDGTVERADLLIGADGLHSSVRALAFGPESAYRADMGHVVGAVPLDRLPAEVAEGSGTTFTGPGRTAAVINLGAGRSSAFFTYRSADADADLARGPGPALGAAFGDLGGGVPAALDQVRADPAATYFDTVSQISIDRWRAGRVVLLGDSAWCVTLFAGYGAALALSGADRLGAALEDGRADIPSALDRWEAALRPATRRRQELAKAGMARFAPPTRAHVWANDLVIRAIRLPGLNRLVERSVRRANH